jgi:hypothetical protein
LAGLFRRETLAGIFELFKNKILSLMSETCLHFSFVYYSNAACQNSDVADNGVPKRVTDAMKSFPSGHAQVSAYAATFFIVNNGSFKTTLNAAFIIAQDIL